MASETEKGLFLLGSLTLGLIVLAAPRKSWLPTSRLIDPGAASGLAQGLPQDEDSFILAAWKMVANDIQYRGYSSSLNFAEDRVQCQRCLLPQQVLKSRQANCVGKSALLTSILRNRLPPERVYAALGSVNNNGFGGHAWVNVQRSDGGWYLLETTMPVTGWRSLPSASTAYRTEAMVNDQGLVCYSPEFCLTVKESGCRCGEFIPAMFTLAS